MNGSDYKAFYLSLQESDKVAFLALVSAQLTIHGRAFGLDLKGKQLSNALLGLNELHHKLSEHIAAITLKDNRYPDDVLWQILLEQAEIYGLSVQLTQSFQFVASKGFWSLSR
jgi:hypothetical protein